MKRIFVIVCLVLLFAVPVNAVEMEAPEVPDSGKDYMPKEPQSFAEGLWMIVKDSLADIGPAVSDGAGICLSLLASVILCSVVKVFPGSPGRIVELVATMLIGYLLLSPSNTLINLGAQTVTELSEYGKLLFPVLTAALAANGGVTKSAALYTGAVAFNTVLCSLISSLIVPMIYVFLCASVASGAIGEKSIERVKGFFKWLVTWGLKIILYVFTGYMGITGVISGSADAAAVKAAKLTISGVVPVVGGILSDASETVLVSAGVVKNSVGIYGMLAVMAVWIGPFIKIGAQYMLLKATCAISEIFSSERSCKLIGDFATALGLLLAMTGTVCLLLLISIVCFMKGVG